MLLPKIILKRAQKKHVRLQYTTPNEAEKEEENIMHK